MAQLDTANNCGSGLVAFSDWRRTHISVINFVRQFFQVWPRVHLARFSLRSQDTSPGRTVGNTSGLAVRYLTRFSFRGAVVATVYSGIQDSGLVSGLAWMQPRGVLSGAAVLQLCAVRSFCT